MFKNISEFQLNYYFSTKQIPAFSLCNICFQDKQTICKPFLAVTEIQRWIYNLGLFTNDIYTHFVLNWALKCYYLEYHKHTHWITFFFEILRYPSHSIKNTLTFRYRSCVLGLQAEMYTPPLPLSIFRIYYFLIHVYSESGYYRSLFQFFFISRNIHFVQTLWNINVGINTNESSKPQWLYNNQLLHLNIGVFCIRW